jgi:hypothetical protein
MVNDGVVNARGACVIHAHFCVLFPALGQIPRFKNPVKYVRGFNIYHETVHFSPGTARRTMFCHSESMTYPAVRTS